MVAACVGAILLTVALHVGFYLIIIVPLGLASGLGFLAGHAVTAGHCRNTAVAVLLGLVAGLVLYVGFLYLSMVSAIGWWNFYRIDVLPKYIEHRMATDVIQDTHSYNQPPRAPNVVDHVFNWFFFAIEAIGVPFITLGIALASVRQVYCEKCGAWKKSYRSTFKPDTSGALIEALNTGRLRALAEIPTVATAPGGSFAVMQVDTCCAETLPTPECSHYFSVGVLKADKNGVLPKTFGAMANRAVLKRVELSSEELSHVAPKFSKLKFIAATAPISTAAPESSAAPVAEAAVPGASGLEPETKPAARSVVEELPVPAPHCGAALQSKHCYWAGFLDALPPLMFLVGMFGALCCCAVLLDFKKSNVPPSALVVALIWLGIATGVVMSLCGGYWSIWKGSPWTMPYLQRTFRKGLENRPARLVEPNDAAAILVEISPREEWGTMTLRNTNEIGLLKVDMERGALLFEGNTKRFCVPAAALTYCQIEQFTLHAGNHRQQSIMVVIRGTDKVGKAGDEWEAPLLPKLSHTLRSKPKVEAAATLLAEIMRLKKDERGVVTSD